MTDGCWVKEEDVRKHAGTCDERLCMYEDGIVHENVHMLVCESGSPPVEGETLKEGLLMEDRGEVSWQGEGQAKSSDLPQQEWRRKQGSAAPQGPEKPTRPALLKGLGIC